MNLEKKLGQVSQIVAVGSVDGVCTAAALLRIIGRPAEEVGLVFTQAFTVDKVDVSGWKPDRKVAFVDLAVNNREPQMTVAFVGRIRAAGHELVAVIDEHSREDWLSVLGSFEGLIIEPQSQNAASDVKLFDAPDGPKSSGEVLYWEILPYAADGDLQVVDLLSAATAGDRMDFTTHFGGIVNSAVKSAIADDSRRVYLARHLAFNREPDEKIRGWIAGYETILANHDKVVASKVDLGDGIHRVVATMLAVDMTTLMGRLYREGAKVVALEGEAFNKSLGRKTVQVSFGTSDKSLDLLAVVKAAVPLASGFAQKVNVDPPDEAAALAAIRAALKK